MSVNKLILIGRLGKDPELRFSPDGKATLSMSLATSERYTDKAGEKVEKTEWHRVVFFGKPAEILGEHSKKGDQLYVEGRVSTRKWQDKSGNDRYSTEVIGDRFQFLGGSGGGKDAPGTEAAAGRPATAARAAEGAAGRPAGAPRGDPGGFDSMDDDIPF